MQGTVQKLVPTDAENRTSLLAELIQAAGIATEGGPESAGNDWLFSVCSLSSVHSFSMPLSSMRLMVWWPWLCPHVVCQAPQHLNSFDWLHILPSAIPYFSQRLLFCSTIYLLFMVAVFFSFLFFLLTGPENVNFFVIGMEFRADQFASGNFARVLAHNCQGSPSGR